MLSASELRTALRKGIVTVTFTKKNGESRTMACTQMLSEVPEAKQPKGGKVSTPEGMFRVFDVDKQDWRAFNYDQVTSIA